MNKKKKVVRKKKRPQKISKKGSSPLPMYLSKYWRYLVLFFILVIICISVFDSKISLNGDNIAYFDLAKSLSSFKGYVYGMDITAAPHAHFPPGYPLLIAPMLWISKSIIWVKTLSCIFYIGSIFFIYSVIKRLLNVSSSISLLTTLAIALNYYLLSNSSMMMSEMALIFVAQAVIAGLIHQRPSADKISWRYVLGLSGLIALAFLIKTLALPLLIGVVAHHIYYRQFKIAGAIFFLTILFASPYSIRNKAYGIGGGYVSELMHVNPYRPEMGQLTFAGLIDRIEHNFSRYLGKEIPSAMLPVSEIGPKEKATTMRYLTGVILVMLMALGLYSLEKYRVFLFFYIGASFGILLIWPEVWYGVRFMLSLIPIMLFLAWKGVFEIINRLSQNEKTRLYSKYAALSLAMFTSIGLGRSIQDNTVQKLISQKSMIHPPAYQNYFDLGVWIKKNIPKEEVIACRKPGLLHAYSNGYALKYPQTTDYQKFLTSMKNMGSRYVIFEHLGYSSTSRFLAPIINQNSDKFEVIQKIPNPDTYLLKLKEY